MANMRISAPTIKENYRKGSKSAVRNRKPRRIKVQGEPEMREGMEAMERSMMGQDQSMYNDMSAMERSLHRSATPRKRIRVGGSY